MSDRERLRDMIRAELDKHRPRENARASLELLAETSILIESGLDTESACSENEVWSEDAVRRAVDELSRKHPLLFREVIEAPNKLPAAAPDGPLLETPAASADKSAAPPAIQPKRPRPRGRYLYAALLALSAFVGFWAGSNPKLGSDGTSVAERSRGPSEPRQPKETSVPSGQPVVKQPPGKLRGIPELIDTATMRLEGEVVRLFGVEWVRGGQAEELASYLRGREVECELASAPDRYRCHVGGNDLSRAVLFNGGGRATGDASPELVEAENNAKAARRGVWQR
jgi:endonuclease YncB( thermonuclease family)